jgi:hypothetical protein
MKMIDMTGQRFERLVCRGISHRTPKIIWEFVCDCGRKVYASGYDVRVGKVKSCGCLRDENTSIRGQAKGTKKVVSGEKRGRLTAIKFSRRYKDQSYWLFQCNCGDICETGIRFAKPPKQEH